MRSALILDNDSARELDRLSRQSIPSLELMERASLAAADFVARLWNALPKQGSKNGNTGVTGGNPGESFQRADAYVLVLAGPGNNGGDALAASRLLHERDIPVRTFLLPGRQSTECIEQLRRLDKRGFAVSPLGADFRPPEGASILVDGLYGIGLRSAMDGGRATMLRALAAYCSDMQKRVGLRVVSLDVPSGLHDAWHPSEPAIRADDTLCFGTAKACLYRQGARAFAGDIHVIDIGFPSEAIEAVVAAKAPETFPKFVNFDDLESLIPEPAVEIHKYKRGLVRIYAGSDSYPGAAVLCANSASLSMAGMVRLCVDNDVKGILSGLRNGVVVDSVVYGTSNLGNGGKHPDVVVAGPGWGRESGRSRILEELLHDSSQPDSKGAQSRANDYHTPVLVLDADALYALAGIGIRTPFFPNLVLTPHHGELARLTGTSSAEVAADPFRYGRRAAETFGAFVVVKGAPLRIVGPDGLCVIVDEANPALAVAGSGDVLAGIIGAQIALALASRESGGMALDRVILDALCAAVLIHTQCAKNPEIAWPDADALVAEIPKVISRYRSPKRFKTMYT